MARSHPCAYPAQRAQSGAYSVFGRFEINRLEELNNNSDRLTSRKYGMRIAICRDPRVRRQSPNGVIQNEPPCGIFVAKQREIDDSPRQQKQAARNGRIDGDDDDELDTTVGI